MGFEADERRVLLALPGIGPGVLQRLEQAGIDSLDALCAVGADAVVLQVCKTLGHGAWRNRHRALQRALALARSGRGAYLQAQGQADADAGPAAEPACQGLPA
jgi:predicted RecB family nuclease